MALRNRKLGTIETLKGQILQETDSGAVVDNERVYQGGSGAKYEDISSQTYKTSIERIRAASNLNPNIIYITPDGGNWVIDPDDTTSQDNTGTVLVTSDGVRVKRKVGDSIDSRIFNIPNDGTSDSSVQFQKMLDAASVLRVPIRLHSGTYLIDGIDIPAYLEIEGVDGDATIESTDLIGFDGEDGELFSVKNITLRTDGTSTSSSRVGTITRYNRVYIGHCVLDGATNGIRIHESRNIHFEENICKNFSGWPIYIEGGTDVTITRNVCFSNGSDGIKFAGDHDSEGFIEPTKNVIITDNICYNNGRDGIDIAIIRLDGLVIQGNVLRDNTLLGIDLKILNRVASEYYIRNAVIQGNNIIENVSGGIFISANSPDTEIEVDILNNTIFGTGGDSPTLNDSIGIFLADTTKGRVIGNYIHRGRCGIQVGRTKNSYIARNTIDGPTRFGIVIRGDGVNENTNFSDNTDTIIEYNNVYSFNRPAIAISVDQDGNESHVVDVTGTVVRFNELSAFSPTIDRLRDFGIGTVKYQNHNGNGTTAIPSIRSTKGDIVYSSDPDLGYMGWVYFDDATASVNNTRLFGKFYGKFPQFEIQGSTVDALNSQFQYASRASNVTLSIVNGYDGMDLSISITNTDTNAHTVTISGVSFPSGSGNSIPAGGRAHIRLQQINGVINSDIKIYT